MRPLTEEEEVQFRTALDFLQSGLWPLAHQALRTLETQHPHPLVLANLALAEERLGQENEARQHHEAAIQLAPNSPDLRFNWANFLARPGTRESLLLARVQYLAVLALDSHHLGAWVNLGTGLVETDHLEAAKTAFTAALAIDPLHSGALLNLAQVALNQQENEKAAQLFEQVLSENPQSLESHRGLATSASRLGQENKAATHRQLGYAQKPEIFLPGRGNALPTVLILASAADGNIPWQPLLDRQRHHTRILALEFFPENESLPPHDLLFNAVGDADRCPEALTRVLPRWQLRAPQIPARNDPQRVRATARTALGQLCAGIPHLSSARTECFQRPAHASPQETAGLLEHWLAARSYAFPLLLRAPGFHGGQYFERVQCADDLPALLERLPGTTLLALECLPSRGQDGLYRKFRVMTLGGNLYPIHLALSSHWKVHYFSAEMSTRPDFREEEQAFLADYRTFLGSTAVGALETLQARLGLDYAGMDFTLDPEGKVLLFEANATMVLHSPPEDPVWDYRRPAFEDALKAARALMIPPTLSHGCHSP
ncbi:MAG: tetratricopeptide repeat protein [Ferrovum myxofaciens]|uniref:tetratricopeptide repeat protein n=1 Tax=Ferrovum myxofaciens TaxID=416213 RepID=UPI0023541309|nr:tetratricopeptide repeat protein [Ferrovum myxofaciens]QKE41463.1 MAG: tetratricopeptide repeat protein [Ferrovum myxofaciens]